MALSGRFVALVALGLVPTLVTGSWAVVGMWLTLCAALVALDLVVAGSPGRIALARELPTRVRLGETAPATLYLTNTGRRRIRAIVRDAWHPSAVLRPRRMPVTLPRGERRALAETFTPIRRGERRALGVTVRSWGPLRLAARQRTLPAPGTVRVLPPFLSRKHLPSRLARMRELDGRTALLVRGQGTEFDSLREYVRGDDVRSIDWRASARRRDPLQPGALQLVVRTWRPERDRRVVLVVDTGRTSAARIADEPRLDTAYESALLLAALATRSGDRVDLLLFDRRVRGRVQGASGPELVQRMVDAMAPVEPELLETDWSAVPTLVRSVTTQRALVVLLTAIETPGAASGLLSVLPQLTRRHQVVVAAVADPALLDARRDLSDREAVYRAAAAERALLDAERVAAAIRHTGGDVVTASPQELPPALADRYIALKASGRL